MIQRLAGVCCVVAAVALALPASAQIIIGGQPATTPGEPVAGAALSFPVDPDKTGYAKISVATPSFTGATEAEAEIARQVAETIRGDLASVGIFTAPDSAAISGVTADIGALPAWADWSDAGASALVLGKAAVGVDGSLVVRVRLYDIAARKQVIGTQYRLPAADQWRRAAHKAADDVMVALVGGKPGFDTRIVFSGEAGGKTQLGIVDSDGVNAEAAIESVPALASPRFSPTTQTIVYSADAPVPGKPNQAQRTTISFDMATGQRAPLTTQAQPNADVRYSADGLSLIYSRKAGTNTDVYMMALATRKETRLTEDKAADSEPALSPDGKMFAFVSDRGGAAQIHVANVDGSPMTCAGGVEAQACRITPEGGGHADPAWSPRGDWIAYSQRVGEAASIHLVRPDGADARTLTSAGAGSLDLHPTWAPEGRRIAFARLAGNRSHIATVDLVGVEPRRLATPGDAYEPDWGPKLP